MCLHACEDPRSHQASSSVALHLTVWTHGLSLNWVPMQLDWRANKPQRSACLHLPSTGSRGSAVCFFTWVLETDPGPHACSADTVPMEPPFLAILAAFRFPCWGWNPSLLCTRQVLCHSASPPVLGQGVLKEARTCIQTTESSMGLFHRPAP